MTKESLVLAATDDAIKLVEVEGNLPAGYMQIVHAGRHTLLVDEPNSEGGKDAGPDPYALLLAALGACTSMTIQMFAERKGMPLRSVRVRLWHRRIHAQDCMDCRTRNGKVDEITREIALEGELTSDQRQRLLDIAERCPVHRSLTSEIKVRSRLTEPVPQ